MKTIKEWILTFPEPYRSQAFENCYTDKYDKITQDELEALRCAFLLNETPQGKEYWLYFYAWLYSGRIGNPPVMPPTTARTRHTARPSDIRLRVQSRRNRRNSKPILNSRQHENDNN